MTVGEVRLLLGVLLIGSTTAGCPEQCHCTKSDTIVSCTGLTDITILAQLPSTVTELYITEGRLESMTLMPRMDTLVKLSITKSALTSAHCMHQFVSVQHLVLSENELVRLGSDDLGGFPGLHSLDLSDNHIASIEWDSLRLYDLRSLSLKGNNLSYIHPHMLRQVQRLQSLDLSHNRILSLPSTTYVLASDIRHLNLSNNRLALLERGSLDALNKLVTLDLSNNALVEVPVENLKALNALEKLYISGNQLSSLKSGDFEGLYHVQYLDVSNSEHLRFVLTDAISLPTIQSVDLSNCSNLIYVSPNAFDGSPNLINVSLSGSSLSYLHPHVWEKNRRIDLTNVTTLDCNCMSSVLTTVTHRTHGTLCPLPSYPPCVDRLILYPPSNTNFTLGTSASLYCTSMLNMSTTEWKMTLPTTAVSKQGGENRVYKDGIAVRIRMVTMEDEGEYTCESGGDTPIKKTINVVVEKPDVVLWADEIGADFASLKWNTSLHSIAEQLKCFLIYRTKRDDDIPTLPRMILLPQQPWTSYTITRLHQLSNYSICLTYMYSSNLTLYETCIEVETTAASRINAQLNMTMLAFLLITCFSTCLICGARCLHRRFYVWQEAKYRARIALSVSGQSFLGSQFESSATSSRAYDRPLHILSNSTSRCSCQVYLMRAWIDKCREAPHERLSIMNCKCENKRRIKRKSILQGYFLQII